MNILELIEFSESIKYLEKNNWNNVKQEMLLRTLKVKYSFPSNKLLLMNAEEKDFFFTDGDNQWTQNNIYGDLLLQFKQSDKSNTQENHKNEKSLTKLKSVPICKLQGCTVECHEENGVYFDFCTITHAKIYQQKNE